MDLRKAVVKVIPNEQVAGLLSMLNISAGEIVLRWNVGKHRFVGKWNKSGQDKPGSITVEKEESQDGNGATPS